MNMSIEEVRLRIAQEDWADAMRRWALAQEHIHAAKATWNAAQAEFFGEGCPEKCQGCLSKI